MAGRELREGRTRGRAGWVGKEGLLFTPGPRAWHKAETHTHSRNRVGEKLTGQAPLVKTWQQELMRPSSEPCRVHKGARRASDRRSRREEKGRRRSRLSHLSPCSPRKPWEGPHFSEWDKEARSHAGAGGMGESHSPTARALLSLGQELVQSTDTRGRTWPAGPPGTPARWSACPGRSWWRAARIPA